MMLNNTFFAFDWHSQSLSIKPTVVSPTLPAAMGMGGPNMTVPLLIVWRKNNQ